jgi:hypothetical protein
LVRQESLRFVQCYHLCLGGLMGRQLSASVTHVADWWLSAWLAAGQPRLQFVSGQDGNERAIEGVWRLLRKGVDVVRKEVTLRVEALQYEHALFPGLEFRFGMQLWAKDQ